MGNLNDIMMFIFYFIYVGVRFKDARNYLPEVVNLDGDVELRRLARGGGGGRGASIYKQAATPDDFEGSFLSGFLDFTERKMWKVAFLGFLHIILVVTMSIKVVLFLKINDGFQSVILILQTCLRKVAPFSVLIYFWVFVTSCMFRILGADNGVEETVQDKYKMYGPSFWYFINSYRQSVGDPQEMQYNFWYDAREEHPGASVIMSLMIWALWFFNQYIVIIFSFNFMVAIIT